MLDRLRPTLAFALIFSASLIAVALGYASYLVRDNVAGVWPPAGVLLAALLQSSRGRWWLLLLGAISAQTLFEQVSARQSLEASLAFSLINAIESLIGARLMQRFVGPVGSLERLRQLVGLLVIGAGVAPAIGASVGAFAILHFYPALDYATVWNTWRAADSLGVLLTTPFLLTLRRAGEPSGRAQRFASAELAAFVVVLAVVVEESLGKGRIPLGLAPSLPYAIFPLLIWASVRFQPVVATTSMFVVGAYAIVHARLGVGPFAVAGLEGREQVVALQMLLTALALNTLVSLVLALEYARSEHERLEVELKRVRSQRMEAVGRLAAGIAHDFNNVLAIVAGNGELLERELARPSLDRAEAEECVRQQRNAAKRGKLMVQQLMALVRRDPVEPATLDLNETLRSLEPTLPHLVGEHVELEIIPAEVPAFTRVDPVRVETAILNLLANARDAMPHGGKLTLELEVRAREIVLLVRDTGTGIAPEHLPRVREAFFTTKPAERGVGLGLTTVCEAVERAGGRVEIESTLGVGTTVACHFPFVAPPPSAPERTTHAPATGQQCILVCEDEDAVRAVAQKFLQSAGYEVLEAPDGYTALKLLEQNHVHMLVTDVALPAMTGFALGERAAALRPGLPVLYMSGHADDALHGPSEPGALNILRKPFTRAELLQRVHAEVVTRGRV